MSLIYNERTRLFATALNNLAVAIMATAIVAPIARVLYGSLVLTLSRLAFLGVAWFLVGVGLHLERFSVELTHPRHPEVLAQRASKDVGPSASTVALRGPASPGTSG